MTYENWLELAILALYLSGMIPTYASLEDDLSGVESVWVLILLTWPLTAVYVICRAVPEIYRARKERKSKPTSPKDAEDDAVFYPIGSGMPVSFGFNGGTTNNSALVEKSGIRFVSVRGEQMYFHKTRVIEAQGGIWAPVEGILVDAKSGQPKIHKRNFQ